MLHCATAQMARFYRLPFEGSSGIDSCLPDAQAGSERAMQALSFGLAGMNFIHLAFGMLDQLLTSSYEEAVIANEIFAAAFQMVRGFEVNAETIALDQIRAAGPGGQFLDQEYTLFRYREHQWQPRLTSRLEWREFQRQKGGKDMRQRANDRARELLANPLPQILDEKLAKELERLARAQQKRHMRGEPKNE